MKVEELQDIVRNQDKIIWTAHGLRQMIKREISEKDVMKCIAVGEIIEEYPTDFPYPSCLIFGQLDKENSIHVVVATDGDFVWVITAYRPDNYKFLDDLKTRR